MRECVWGGGGLGVCGMEIAAVLKANNRLGIRSMCKLAATGLAGLPTLGSGHMTVDFGKTWRPMAFT